MISKLDQQPDRNDNARDVRSDERRVTHYLQDRGPIVFLETSLVVGLAAIAQRVIHIDKDIAIHRPLRIDQRDLAGEVLWNIGADVALVREFLERDAVRLVVTSRAHD